MLQLDLYQSAVANGGHCSSAISEKAQARRLCLPASEDVLLLLKLLRSSDEVQQDLAGGWVVAQCLLQYVDLLLCSIPLHSSLSIPPCVGQPEGHSHCGHGIGTRSALQVAYDRWGSKMGGSREDVYNPLFVRILNHSWSSKPRD